MKPDLGELQ